MFLICSAAEAQGIKFGYRYAKQRAGAAAENTARNINKISQETKAQERSSDAPLDEYSEKVDDVIYRYVYAYGKDNMRSSETIYKKEKIDGVWGSETLYDVGKYEYEYDGAGRVSVKAVTYGKNEDFKSYRIMADYSDTVTAYRKYNIYDASYELVEEWGYHDNGVLAFYTYYDYEGYKTDMFDENGLSSGYSSGSSKVLYAGSINDRTLTHYENSEYDGSGEWTTSFIENYKYDEESGKLLEYMVVYSDSYDYSGDDEKLVYTYDEFGRLKTIKEYGIADDEVDIGVDPGYEDEYASTRAIMRNGISEPEWELDYEAIYTYSGNDVYGIGNSWHDVFGFDGPLSKVTEGYNEYDYDLEKDVFKQTSIDFQRDASGKLLSVSVDGSLVSEGDGSTTELTVDDNGHIVKIIHSNGSYSTETNTYTWENGQCIRNNKHYLEQYGDGHVYEDISIYDYSYGDNSVTFKQWDEESSDYSITTISQNGNTYDAHYKWYDSTGNPSSEEHVVRAVQTEDISFVRPNAAIDIDGFTRDSIIVVSKAGRVVCAINDEDGPYDDEYTMGFTFMDVDDSYHYVNAISGETYFSISHDGDETICSDMDGLPIYVLSDGKLVREYKYYDVGSGNTFQPGDSEGSGSVYVPDYGTRSVSIPDGQVYDEITYMYDEKGRFAGKKEVSVDEDGTRTEEIILEYKYNEALGIASAELEAKAGVTVNGRTIGLSDGSRFSICTIGGQKIADGVDSFTFSSAGVYIVVSDGITVKVLIK